MFLSGGFIYCVIDGRQMDEEPPTWFESPFSMFV